MLLTTNVINANSCLLINYLPPSPPPQLAAETPTPTNFSQSGQQMLQILSPPTKQIL